MDRRDFLNTSILSIGSALLLSSVKAATSDFQIGIYTRPWAEFHYLTALDEIAKAGYRHIGLMTTKSKNRLVISVDTDIEKAKHIGDQAEERGLSIISVYGGGFLDKSVSKSIGRLKKLIDNVAACRGKNLLLGGTGDQDQFELYYNTVRECCDHAESQNVHLTLKPHGGLNATGPQCRRIIETVDHTNFTLWYDPGNIYYYSEGELNPVDDCNSVKDIITGMCVKDYLPPKNVSVTPGTGQVKFPSIFKTLYNSGFTSGPLVIECLTPGPLEFLFQEAIKAQKYLMDLIQS